MDVLAFPFRLDKNGAVALVQQGSEAHLAQQAYQFVNTRVGELPLAPTYGLDDPLFRVVERGEIITGLALFHPDVEVVDVTIRNGDRDGTSYIGIEFAAATVPAVPVEAEVIFGAQP